MSNELVSDQSNISNIDLEKQLLTEKQVSIILFSLLEGLSHYVLSEDIWWFVKKRARDNAIGLYGISEEDFDDIMLKLDFARNEVSKDNILKSLFWQVEIKF